MKAICDGKSIFNWIYASALLLRTRTHSLVKPEAWRKASLVSLLCRFTNIGAMQNPFDHINLWKSIIYRMDINIYPPLKGKEVIRQRRENTYKCARHFTHLPWGLRHGANLEPLDQPKPTSHDTLWRWYKGSWGGNSALCSNSIKPGSYIKVSYMCFPRTLSYLRNSLTFWETLLFASTASTS